MTSRSLAAVGGVLAWVGVGSSTIPPQPTDMVRTCQVGYLPGETKVGLVTGDQIDPKEAQVVHLPDEKVVLTAPLSKPVNDPDTGDLVRSVDFSSVTKAGSYYLNVPGVGSSFQFKIGKDTFARPFRLSMRMFTGQRCGTKVDLSPDFPQYKHDECHMGDAEFHASSGKTGTKECLGGWHDAGDFGRYVVNSGITTGTLLWAYELNARKLRKVNLDLPESGNGTPDMLNEIRWNLKWMLKMQDNDGGVWHKATSAQFCGFIKPEADKATVLIIGSGKAPYKTTASTGDFAAVCSIAARVYRPFDRKFADQCLASAEKAWTWLASTPDAMFVNNPWGIGTGGYGDSNVADERLWAAAELFRTTGKAIYDQYFLDHYKTWTPTLSEYSAQGWGDVHNMAMYAYAMSGRKSANQVAVDQIKTDGIKAADALVARAQKNAYRIPMQPSNYNWGSNAVVGNYAMMLLLANHIAPKAEYVNCAQDTLHYLLGRNTFNTSFVTQVGSRWPMHPHHRPSASNGIEQPWPGMLVGGPNAGRSTIKPAREWVDKQADYTRNEVAINWNAPLVFVLAEAMP